MSENKRIRIAGFSLGITIVSEIIRTQISKDSSLFDFLHGFELVFLLIAIGYSAKLAGTLGTEKKVRNHSFLILTASTALAVYIYIL